ncbi:DUF7848 domain-containing protein [Streptomyces silvisoli]|uniref:DUF7848 domain-containing protein n=1 Tax=Streptomyces silvisoli TaxID=3034235 RepID=A0ABT5ZMU3_9ACTN|nr:hypothetical protein [Streptomyces silvisoli]MDF3291150.1 hypothetical protein [Streptomyces silvisoli]
MSAHTVIRRADWMIGPETAPEAPRIVFEMECMRCDEASQASEEFEDVRDWAFQHVGRNPSHTGFREIIHRFWRATLLR